MPKITVCFRHYPLLNEYPSFTYRSTLIELSEVIAETTCKN